VQQLRSRRRTSSSSRSNVLSTYTAPPAHGPMMAEICGTTPEASTFIWNTSAYLTRGKERVSRRSNGREGEDSPRPE
jgi:hypothetical protein